MRATVTNDGLKVHAVAGTYVVTLGFDMTRAKCAGLLGFSVHRTDHKENEAYYLEAMKAFAETDPGFPAGSLYSTADHPVQSFQWADYSAKPGHRYTYKITALKGTPQDLTPYASVVVEVETESPENGDHDIYFNRGSAASQEYVRRFGDRLPEKVPNHKAFEWLSRGLFEALGDFIKQADGGNYALRVAAYEFAYEPVHSLLKAAIDRGVDVQIVYDARGEPPRDGNRAGVEGAGLNNVCTERTANPSAISHNKFIVLLKNGAPKAVWTGGTNFSKGGIYGHSNVAHVVEDEDVAQKFLDYWTLLSEDPEYGTLRDAIDALSPLPDGAPREGATVIFSPRNGEAALDWYAELARNAQEGLMMTFAFGMNDLFKEVYRSGNAPFRLALLEKIIRSMPAKTEAQKQKKADEIEAMQQLRNMPENTFAVGSYIQTNQFDGWVKERLSDLNTHVRYVHNKFMLIDPLSDDPIVVAGSANFSAASTTDNDENMVVVRGNTRVADIYLGEFMRLYSHFAFRESLQWRDDDEPPKPLRTDDWWRDYFGDTERSVRRKFFARSQ